MHKDALQLHLVRKSRILGVMLEIILIIVKKMSSNQVVHPRVPQSMKMEGAMELVPIMGRKQSTWLIMM